ncbi:MAG: DMT family transporter [Chitinophagia bacterium]|nr:DMT family transporter [Chitinophagia bacterium]
MTYLKLILVAIMWGGTFIATKMAAEVFGSFTGASFRYLFALAFMIPMMWLKDRRSFAITPKQFRDFLILGASGIFAYSFFFFNGLRLVSASHGALIVALNPVLVLIMTAIMGREKINGIKIIGIIASLAGTSMVIARGNYADLFSMFTWGDAFMLGCPISWAFYTYFAKDALKGSSPLQASTWAIIMGLCLILLFVPTETFPRTINPSVWLALLYLGVCGSVLGFVWYYEGIQKIGPLKTSAFNNLIPIFAMILSVVLLGETIHGYMIYGSALVIGGVYLINRV